MNVQLSVKPYLSLSITNTFSSVSVSSGDLAAGFKDYPSVTTVTATTNSTNGFVISVLLKVTNFGVQQVYPSGTVTIDGVTYPLTPGVYTNITVPYNGNQTQSKTLSYRFNLNPSIPPGTYAWPIVITGSAL